MGLDFSHGDAHWSYSGFMRFRERLATEIGMELGQMEGFELLRRVQQVDEFLSGHVAYAARPGASWSGIDDPIALLINHSDCDGELPPEHCAWVAPRLRQLIASWPLDDFDRIQAERLASGMDEAAMSGVSLEFC